MTKLVPCLIGLEDTLCLVGLIMLAGVSVLIVELIFGVEMSTNRPHFLDGWESRSLQQELAIDLG